MSKKRFVFAAVALLVLLVACGKERTSSNPQPGERVAGQKSGSAGQQEGRNAALSAVSKGAEPQPEPGAPDEVRAGAPVASQDLAATGRISSLPLPNVGVKVIKTANLSVEVKKGSFQDSFSKASLVAEKLGGFVTGSSVSETKGKVASGIITLRIPSEKFQTALSELRALGKVSAEEQSGQDVSQEFVDLEARLRHAKVQETFYMKLMDRAESVSDLIQIQSQLSQVQLQIEELTGRLEFLKNQTTLSTVTVRIFEPGVEPGKPKTTLGKAWQEALDGFKSVVSGLIVALGWIAPIALLAVALFALWRLRSRSAGPGSS